MIEPARPIAAGIPAPIPQAQPQPAPAKAQEDTAAAAPENASATPAEQAAAPAAKETTAQSPPPEPPKTAAPVPMAAPAPASAPAGPAGRHTLKAVVHAQTWLRIDTDGQTIRQVLLRPGESLSWEADQYFRLRVGNAGGIVLFLDGEQLPALGGSGEVRDLTLPAGRGTKP